MKKIISALLIAATLILLAIPVIAVSTPAASSLDYNIETELRWMGRTYAKQNKHFFNWSSSGFEFCFKGSGATAVIESDTAAGGKHSAYIKIYIDGVEQPDVALTNSQKTIVLAKDLDPNVKHTVKVVKRTNARSSTAALVSLTLADGEKLAPPANATRYIEFVGDSLTVGYSTISKADQGSWSTIGEDSTKTYNEPAANAFYADYSIVAISGRGIVRNSDGGTDKLLSTIYNYLDQYNNSGVAYDFARQPDVVVINLGENDAAKANSDLTSEAFRTGLRAFLLNVRAKNPKAEIVYTYGLTDTKFSEDMAAVIAQLRSEGDTHISYTQLKYCYDDERIVNHPTYEAYQARTQSIIDAISAATGWTPYEDPNKTTPDDTTPAETTPVETTPVETTPAETIPAVTIPVWPFPTEPLPSDTLPVWPLPKDTTPAETTPAETTPVETTPVETTPVETTPAETTPAETTPVETTPAETTPVETTPAETTLAETTPTDTTPTTPDVTEPTKNGGCGSALLPMTLLGTLTIAGVALGKKKERK